MKRSQPLFVIYDPRRNKYLVDPKRNVWQDDLALAWVTNSHQKAINKVRIDLGLDHLKILPVVPALAATGIQQAD